MRITLDARAQKFVKEQVASGSFRSPEDVLQEALNRMMAEAELALDDETAAAINRAEEQIDCGEGIDFDKFAAEWRKKLGVR